MEKTFKNNLFKLLSDLRILLNPTSMKMLSGKYYYFYNAGGGGGGESAPDPQQWCKGPRGESKKSCPNSTVGQNKRKKNAKMS